MCGMLMFFNRQAAAADETSPLAVQNGGPSIGNGALVPGGAATPGNLMVNEPLGLYQFRQQENQTLTTYGWIDRNAGVVRIPIERAKELLLERGLPARAQTAQGKIGDDNDSALGSRRPAFGARRRAGDRRGGAGGGADGAGAAPAGQTAATQVPILKDVGIDQKLDAQVPLDAALRRRDRAGRHAGDSTSAGGRSCWRSSTTSARCCARRC